MTRPRVERLAALFRDALEATGLTQVQLAEVFGVHQTTVSKWLTGKTQPPLEHLPTIEKMRCLPRGRLLRASGFVEPDASVPAAIDGTDVLDDAAKALVHYAYDYAVRTSKPETLATVTRIGDLEIDMTDEVERTIVATAYTDEQKRRGILAWRSTRRPDPNGSERSAV